MPHPRNTRRLAALALIPALLAGLSGCFLLPIGPGLPEGDERDAPDLPRADSAIGAAVGDCWAARVDDLVEWSTWAGDGPVDCDTGHQTYSFFVGELEEEVEDAWDGTDMTGELAQAISDQCYPLLDELLGGNERLQRIDLFFFVPSPADWEDGEHLIRCDLALFDIGSDYYAPDVAELVGDLDDFLAGIEDDPRAFELCLAGDGAGPYESHELVYADCHGGYDFRFAGGVEFPAEPDAEYPGEEALGEEAEESCAALGPEGEEAVYFYVPLPEMWEQGIRTIECWFSLSLAVAPPEVV